MMWIRPLSGRRIHFRSRSFWSGLALLVATFGLACAGGIKEDPIMRLSAEEALDQGKQLMEAKKYRQASDYLSHAFEVAPNSAVGREALLLVADAFYLAGGSTNYIKAEAKYRDFLNRFPTSERADYVQVQIANCLAEQMRRPDRDQSATIKALEAFELMIQLYPTSDYAADADQRIVEIRQNLAEHEYLVGKYNYRRRLYPAAVSRLSDLLEDYPSYQGSDKALYFLGRAYLKTGQTEKAAASFARLRDEYPDSKYVKKIPTVRAEQ